MKGLKIAIGSDHAGYMKMLHVRKLLCDWGVDVINLGPDKHDPDDDYPDYAHPVAQAVSEGKVDFGVLICGTGKGMAITANKTLGVRAVTIANEEEARLTRAHNNANCACFGANSLRADLMGRLFKIFVRTTFEGGRHARRVNKIEV